MISSGIFEHWHCNELNKMKNFKLTKKKSNKSDASSNKHDDQIKPLTNIQLQSAYYFYLIGIGISILSIFIEVNSFFIF